MNYQIKHEDEVIAIGNKEAVIQFISKVFDENDVKNIDNVEFGVMAGQVEINKTTEKIVKNGWDNYTIKLDGKFYINSYDLIIIDSLTYIFGLDYDVAEDTVKKIKSNVIIDSTIGRIEIIKNV